MPDVDTLLKSFQDGQRLALSRLLSLLARGEHTHKIRAALPSVKTPPRIVAITGSAGVGKSTLIGKFIDEIRKSEQSVAVLACDPQSPISGGALLGDRFRIPSRSNDDGVYIRSLPALSGHGAVAEHLPDMMRLLAAFGFDVILIETVGAGQGDVAVSELADVVVLLLQPETGDDLQWEKAGVLEVADIIAVQKADLPRAEQVAGQVRAALELSGTTTIPVFLVSAKTGQGVPELWQAITAHSPRPRAEVDPGIELLGLAQEELAGRFRAMQAAGNPMLNDLVQRWQTGKIATEEARSGLLELLTKRR